MQDILILNNLSFILILILNVIHVAKGAHWFSNKYIFINYLMVMDRNSAMIAILDDSIVNVPNLHSQFKFHFTFIEDCQILVIVCEIFVRFLAFSNGLCIKICAVFDVDTFWTISIIFDILQGMTPHLIDFAYKNVS
jgi:hypothetical protein